MLKTLDQFIVVPLLALLALVGIAWLFQTAPMAAVLIPVLMAAVFVVLYWREKKRGSQPSRHQRPQQR